MPEVLIGFTCLDGLAGGLLVGVDQPGVGRTPGEQLGVGAAVGDPAAVEVHDLVGEPDGGLAVGDHDQRRRAASLPAGRARMRASTSGSTADVASSRISRRGRRTRARASEMRCRWPPESDVPRSPSRVSRPSGSAATKPSACAVRSAAQTSASVMSAPRVTLPRTVSSKRNAVCGTTATPRPARRGRGRAGRGRRPGSGRRRGRRAGSAAWSACSCRKPWRPTSATVRPGLDGEGRGRRAAAGRARRSRRGGRRRAARRGRRAAAARRRTASRRWPSSTAVHPAEADDAAGELTEQPADRADRERRRW